MAPSRDTEARGDLERVERALELALRGRYRVAPNPRVGAVLVHEGRVVGEGWHREVGGPHAEIEALAAGGSVRGATLFVTLEPCSHFGRTPPCADAVIAAGIARVVACTVDPNPLVAGRGFAKLRAAGVEVEVGLLAEEAIRANLGFYVPHLLARPTVTLKWAMSWDGKIATASGESRWISSAEGRDRSLELREEHDAILVGSGTVLADDPRLDRRLDLASGPNLRVVLDRRLRFPPNAAMLDHPGPVLIYTESRDAAKLDALTARGAEVVSLAAPQTVEPESVLADLFARGLRSVLVEGGGEIAAAFAASGLFDRVTIDAAPILLGGRTAPSPLGGAGLGALAKVPRLEAIRTSELGGDLILDALRAGAVRDLFAGLSNL